MRWLIKLVKSFFKEEVVVAPEPVRPSPKDLYEVAVTVAQQAVLRSATGIKLQPTLFESHRSNGAFASLETNTVYLTPKIVEMGKDNLVDYVEATVMYHVSYLKVDNLEKKLDRMQSLRNKAIMTYDTGRKLDLFLSERNLGYWIAKEARERAKELSPHLATMIDEVAADQINQVEDILDEEVKKVDSRC